MTQLALIDGPVRRWASVSPCGRFRYLLGREWDATKQRTLFVMLNPSTADADADDPTVRRCVSFATRWGHGSIEIVNLFALRATDPQVLKKAIRQGEPVGADGNADDAIRCAAKRAEVIVVAWGAHVDRQMQPRATFVADMLSGRSLMCLGRSADGQPRHPLMLAGATPLEHFFRTS